MAAADDPKETSVSVRTSGRLRHGVMAIGGETTGTTLTANGVVWELQLHSDKDRAFAEEHNKQRVVVSGSLRKVTGIETEPRWIVDVEELTVLDAETTREATQMTVVGTLQASGLQCKDAELVVRSGTQVWPLDFPVETKLKPTAESLVGQAVRLTGDLEPIDVEARCAPGSIRVTALDRSPDGASETPMP